MSHAPSHPHVIPEFPPEWNVTLDTAAEVWNPPTRDEKTATASVKAPSDSTSSEKPHLDRVDTTATFSEEEIPLAIVGSTDIYDEEGRIRLIPVS